MIERTALAMLRGGCSYNDAALSTRLSVEHVMRLWRENKTTNRPEVARAE